MDQLNQIPLTLSTVDTGAIAGSTNTFTTTAASAGFIKGKWTTALAALTNQAPGASGIATTDANTGVAFAPILPNMCAAIVFGVTAAGLGVAVQGPQVATNPGVTTTVGSFAAAPQFPALPDNFMPIAYTVVRVAPSGGTGFVNSSTSWTASSMSCTTFQRISSLPNRPQIA